MTLVDWDGVLLDPDDQPGLEQAALTMDILLGDVYRRLLPIRERLAELRGPAVLPRPSRRTVTQERVARCKRCGGRQTDVAMPGPPEPPSHHLWGLAGPQSPKADAPLGYMQEVKDYDGYC